MKKLFTIIITLVILITISTVTCGNSYRTVKFGLSGYGARADAMGGAFTAVANDGFAPYWNPAGMTQLKVIAITGNLGDFVREEFNGYNSVYGFTGFTTRFFALNCDFDLVENFKEDENGCTNLNTVDEAILSVAFPVGKFLSIGGNAKMTFATLDKMQGLESIIGVGSNFGYDLGALFTPNETISLGIMGRNLNQPSINVYENTQNTYLTTVVIPASITMGLALKPSKYTILTGDFEMINKKNNLHLGIEQTALWNIIAVRFGMTSDLNKMNDPVISGGVGLKIFGFYIDAAMIGLKDPEYAEMEASFGFRY